MTHSGGRDWSPVNINPPLFALELLPWRLNCVCWRHTISIWSSGSPTTHINVSLPMLHTGIYPLTLPHSLAITWCSRLLCTDVVLCYHNYLLDGLASATHYVEFLAYRLCCSRFRFHCSMQRQVPGVGVGPLPRGTQGVVSQHKEIRFSCSTPPLYTTMSNFFMFSAFIFVVRVAVSHIGAFSC